MSFGLCSRFKKSLDEYMLQPREIDDPFLNYVARVRGNRYKVDSDSLFPLKEKVKHIAKSVEETSLTSLIEEISRLKMQIADHEQSIVYKREQLIILKEKLIGLI